MAHRGRHCRITPRWFWRLDDCMRRNPGLTRRQASKIVAQVDAEMRKRRQLYPQHQLMDELNRRLAGIKVDAEQVELLRGVGSAKLATDFANRVTDAQNVLWRVMQAYQGDATAMEDAKVQVLRLKGK